MRKILATAAVAGVMTIGLAAAPAQAATTTQSTGIGACTAVKIISKNFKAVEVEGPGSVRDGLFNRTDLRAVLHSDAPRYVRKSALRLLSGSLFHRLDTAGHGGAPDGLISQDDLRAFLRHVCF